MTVQEDVDNSPESAEEHLRRAKLSLDWLIGVSQPYCGDARCKEVVRLLERAAAIADGEKEGIH